MQKFKDLSFVKSLKLKFSKTRVVSLQNEFRDFFPFENICSNMGFSFLPNLHTKPAKWKKIHSTMHQFSFIIFALANLCSAYISLKIPLTDESIISVIENFFFVGASLGVLIKMLIVFYIHKSTLVKIIERLKELFQNSSYQFQAYEYLKVLKKFAKTQAIIFIVMGIEYCLVPFFHQLYGIFKDEHVKLELIIPIRLPFDETKPLVYELVCALEAWIILVVATVVICTDFTFVSLVHILCMNFDDLREMISKIDNSVERLKKVIKIHQELIEISEDLENIFSVVLFINIFASISAMCTAAFLIAVNIWFKDKRRITQWIRKLFNKILS